ncbi:MAG: molecular chaperone HtpG [Thermodesulfobacteriota bacterium]|nr:MAG: molecular chaperone HtpG [Thermodesulfobacteriota bacterium]
MAEKTTKKHEFQAEVKQVLDIVINSLYTDKEVFIRELVSNASDALEKLRYIQLTEKEIYDEELPLEITITTDDKENTITIEDHGIGMTRDDLSQNLGTIAHSGSKAFLSAVKKGGEVNQNLIGQFGVGFYSVFMVAKSVEVYTHNWTKTAKSLLWKSDGSGTYEIESAKGVRRGTKIVVHLKDEDKEFSNSERVKHILTHYSSFVQFPIKLNGEQINNIQPIWMRNKNEITDEEYTEFYKFQANAFDEPNYRMHFSSDAPIEINSLIFVPKMNPEQMGFGKVDPGVSLYCKKVLIDNKPEGLLPDWMRFLKGVVDSADLPLNISRESMQDSALTNKIGQVITGRFIKTLEDESKKNAEKYNEFYKNFSIFIKEGVAADFKNRDQLAKLLRYESSATEKDEFTTLQDYVDRTKEEQKEIYYLYAPNRETIDSGPHLEAFKAHGIEVLYLYEPVDEFVMTSLAKYADKDLVSADNSDIELEEVAAKKKKALSRKDSEALCEWIKESLGESINEVSVSKRLVDSPAIALNADKVMSPSMRRMMKAMKQGVDMKNSVNLEINTKHDLIKNLSALKDKDADTAKLVTEQILDNALIAAGYLEDPRDMVSRVYKLLEKVSEK